MSACTVAGLYTKSIQCPSLPDDGLRVCVMRRPGDNEREWDVKMPALAPSHALLTDYHQHTIDWDQFTVRFQREVIEGQKDQLMALAAMAQTRKVTILCFEETPEKCHRRLLAEAIQKLFPNLKVVIQ